MTTVMRFRPCSCGAEYWKMPATPRALPGKTIDARLVSVACGGCGAHASLSEIAKGVTVLPLASPDTVESSIAMARRSAAAHHGRCVTCRSGLDCRRLSQLLDVVDNARARLDAVLSQQPERHIPPDGARRRRVERIYQQAAAA